MLGFDVNSTASQDTSDSANTSSSDNEDIEKDTLLEMVDARDLVSFGMIPEFVGRLPIVCSVRSMDETALLAVLTKPRNALVQQYTLLFEKDGVSRERETQRQW